MKNRILLTIVALVVLPTALLSLMAGRAVRSRELVIMQQMKTSAGSMTRLCSETIDAGIKDELNRVRETIGAVLTRTASVTELGRVAETLETSSPIVRSIVVYHDPWDVVYPPGRQMTVGGEPSQPKFAESIRIEIAQLSQGRTSFSMNDDGVYYCFTLIPGRKDLYAGFEVDLIGFRDMLDRALAKLASEDIVLSAKGRMYEPSDTIIVEDSLSPEPTREPVESESNSTSELLAQTQLVKPFSDVTVSAYARNPAQMLQTGRNQSKLLVWGIALLAGGILAGVIILSFQIHQEIRRTSARANYIIGISHDLRTPIASLKMLTESLYSGTIKNRDKQREFLGTMAGECDRLNRLVERVLYFVRFGEDALVYFKKTIEVKALLNETVDSFFVSSSRPRTHVNVTVDVDDNVPEIDVDDNAISQVLLNLLDNALKYGLKTDATDKPCITVSAVTVERSRRFMGPAKKWVRISVADNGPGILPGDIRKLFRPYFRAKSALNANVSGVGLGLALCRHIAHAHNGRIEAGNVKSGGAVFSIYIPCQT